MCLRVNRTPKRKPLNCHNLLTITEIILNCRSRLIEVYGSLLLSLEREKTLERNGKPNGIMKEVGKVERKGWKLSFDRYSEKKKPAQAVLNLVYTGNQEDVFYTTVYEVDLIAYRKILNREMGKYTAKRWKHGRLSDVSSYRPIQLDSEFGITDIFVIPFHGRQRAQTDSKASYVKTVQEGIEQSYTDEKQREANLKALKRAVEESKTI